VGPPIQNTQLYVLGAGGSPVPAGEVGEIYIGGPGVGCGYLHDPVLTSKRFVTDPSNGQRLYRTGDYGRVLPDGQLEFVGRGDSQVKVDGFRVDLGEVEAALCELPSVGQAAAAALVDGSLVAWVVGDGVESNIVRQSLQASVPDRLIPRRVIVVEALPLTVNGKVDRQRLVSEARNDAAASEGGAQPMPTSLPALPGVQSHEVTADAICALWADELGLHISARESVFDNGASSLAAIRVADRLGALVGMAVPVAWLFDNPTPSGLARCLAARLDTPPAVDARIAAERRAAERRARRRSP
jgi:hypothetical protein